MFSGRPKQKGELNIPMASLSLGEFPCYGKNGLHNPNMNHAVYLKDTFPTEHFGPLSLTAAWMSVVKSGFPLVTFNGGSHSYIRVPRSAVFDLPKGANKNSIGNQMVMHGTSAISLGGKERFRI